MPPRQRKVWNEIICQALHNRYLNMVAKNSAKHWQFERVGRAEGVRFCPRSIASPYD
jgi:hypothetical protein